MKSEILLKYGQVVRKIRLEKGISQETLADLSGLHRTYMSDVELGKRNVSLENIDRIANALDVSADDLLAENLIHTSSNVGKELHTVLQNCSPKEKELIIRVVMFLKDLFSEFEI